LALFTLLPKPPAGSASVGYESPGHDLLLNKLPATVIISATVVGMAILKDAVLSIVIAVTASETLGWAWYILGLLLLGQ
jgi:hypothetical protein